jgi:hypothetical protein
VEPQLSTYLDDLLDRARERVALAASREPLAELRRRAAAVDRRAVPARRSGRTRVSR